LNSENKYLVLDAGNTRVKIARFLNDEMLNFSFFEYSNFNLIQEFIESLEYEKSIISSVGSKENTKKLKSLLKNCFDVKELKYPIKFDYKSIETLGVDRIANAVAAFSKSQTDALIIDVGTCIKFDFVNKDGIYKGGSISPGIHLRYKSLNDYTANLPLLKNTDKTEILGDSTKNCIQSGVLNGIQGEINYFIERYSKDIKDLTIFVTGGDYKYFDYSSKNNIFAVENLTIFGLFKIIKANEQ
jgi:type III pantothenate kinase